MGTNKNTYNGIPEIWDKSIDVPEIPLSYSFTGVRKNVIPVALMIPASVSISSVVGDIRLKLVFLNNINSPFMCYILYCIMFILHIQSEMMNCFEIKN